MEKYQLSVAEPSLTWVNWRIWWQRSDKWTPPGPHSACGNNRDDTADKQMTGEKAERFQVEKRDEWLSLPIKQDICLSSWFRGFLFTVLSMWCFGDNRTNHQTAQIPTAWLTLFLKAKPGTTYVWRFWSWVIQGQREKEPSWSWSGKETDTLHILLDDPKLFSVILHFN